MQLSRISLFPSLRDEEDVEVEEEIIPESLQWKPEGNGFVGLRQTEGDVTECPHENGSGDTGWEQSEADGELVCDVYETDRDVIVVAPIAGVRSEDLDITVANDLLTVRGTRKHGASARNLRPIHRECHWGTFSRTLVLPSEVKSDRVKAFLKQGVLTILLPKIRESRVRVEEVGM
jgi:HSP20 family molecular chaperone IbpA